jgi:hypothetical protein
VSFTHSPQQHNSSIVNYAIIAKLNITNYYYFSRTSFFFNLLTIRMRQKLLGVCPTLVVVVVNFPTFHTC